MAFTETKESSRTDKPPGPFSGGIGPDPRQLRNGGGEAG